MSCIILMLVVVGLCLGFPTIAWGVVYGGCGDGYLTCRGCDCLHLYIITPFSFMHQLEVGTVITQYFC